MMRIAGAEAADGRRSSCRRAQSSAGRGRMIVRAEGRCPSETRWQTANQEMSCSYGNTWQIVVDNMRESRCLEGTGGRRDDSSTPLFGRLRCESQQVDTDRKAGRCSRQPCGFGGVGGEWDSTKTGSGYEQSRSGGFPSQGKSKLAKSIPRFSQRRSVVAAKRVRLGLTRRRSLEQVKLMIEDCLNQLPETLREVVARCQDRVASSSKAVSSLGVLWLSGRRKMDEWCSKPIDCSAVSQCRNGRKVRCLVLIQNGQTGGRRSRSR
ncbi:hypothetical protein QBC44DRAFT_62647 [Cladorrhinum sp. PSN332]|nr:hypothetical protein QBC44DRAFT_62647 [Cladorrhinum sp. PSN332]